MGVDKDVLLVLGRLLLVDDGHRVEDGDLLASGVEPLVGAKRGLVHSIEDRGLVFCDLRVFSKL